MPVLELKTINKFTQFIVLKRKNYKGIYQIHSAKPDFHTNEPNIPLPTQMRRKIFVKVFVKNTKIILVRF